MRILFCLTLGILAVTGCSLDNSVSSGSTSNGASPLIAIPANADNPPVTMSGYVDTSVTKQ
jgi:hypothetical protein